jgi:hypothetical protein
LSIFLKKKRRGRVPFFGELHGHTGSNPNTRCVYAAGHCHDIFCFMSRFALCHAMLLPPAVGRATPRGRADSCSSHASIFGNPAGSIKD